MSLAVPIILSGIGFAAWLVGAAFAVFERVDFESPVILVFKVPAIVLLYLSHREMGKRNQRDRKKDKDWIVVMCENLPRCFEIVFKSVFYVLSVIGLLGWVLSLTILSIPQNVKYVWYSLVVATVYLIPLLTYWSKLKGQNLERDGGGSEG